MADSHYLEGGKLDCITQDLEKRLLATPPSLAKGSEWSEAIKSTLSELYRAALPRIDFRIPQKALREEAPGRETVKTAVITNYLLNAPDEKDLGIRKGKLTALWQEVKEAIEHAVLPIAAARKPNDAKFLENAQNLLELKSSSGTKYLEDIFRDVQQTKTAALKESIGRYTKDTPSFTTEQMLAIMNQTHQASP